MILPAATACKRWRRHTAARAHKCSSLHCDVITGGDLTASEFRHETFAGGACVRVLGGDWLAGGWRSRPVTTLMHSYSYAMRCDASRACVWPRPAHRCECGRAVCVGLSTVHCSALSFFSTFPSDAFGSQSLVFPYPNSEAAATAAATVVNS